MTIDHRKCARWKITEGYGIAGFMISGDRLSSRTSVLGPRTSSSFSTIMLKKTNAVTFTPRLTGKTNSHLGGREIDITQDKQRRENPYQHGNFAKLASRNLHYRVRNQAEADASSNAESQWRGQHRNKCRNRLAKLAPFNMRNRLRHQRAHQDQRRRRSIRRNRSGERRAESRNQKQPR